MEIGVFTGLFILILGIVVAYFIGLKIGLLKRERFWSEEMKRQRKDAVQKSRSVLIGQFSEQLAPYFPNFKFDPNDCKFIGSPIDFIVFEGSSKGRIDKVFFLEVKSGKSKLSKKESDLKKAIEDGKVFWDEFRV